MNDCQCWYDCQRCSLSGHWHVHTNHLCPAHPNRPGDYDQTEVPATTDGPDG